MGSRNPQDTYSKLKDGQEKSCDNKAVLISGVNRKFF